jgi:hypothetical protein
MQKLDDKGFSQLVPMVLAVVIVFALLFVGNFVIGTIHNELGEAVSDTDTSNTMNNISENWDTGIDLMQVTIIITILAGAIAAIFLFTRFNSM